METITINNDITVFYVTAKTYPDGIKAAHEKLHTLIPFSEKRRYFGISRPEDGGEIVYRAAAEELVAGEGKKLNLETVVLKKGKYRSITLHDYLKNLDGIYLAFQEILEQPDLDPNGYCVEWYTNNIDVQCMVRLA